MKQLVLRRSGELQVLEVPAPVVRPGGVLVRTRFSAISPGTERSTIEAAGRSVVAKVRDRPEQLRQLFDTARQEGLGRAVQKVRTHFDTLSALGYSLSGVVESLGPDVVGLRPGQRVTCAGSAYASHAELVWVPVKLVTPVPDDVRLDHAAFATIGAIALHGVRQAGIALGEVVAVVGLGLIGQITLQLLRAAGARPIGIDVDPSRVEHARGLGFTALQRGEDVAGTVRGESGGLGADAVLVTASTSSDDPLRLAAKIMRDRGRVVIVGAVPLTASRDAFFAKELELRLSRSYGPGRYDPSYEEKGNDYPPGYVRWTEGRNLGEFVRLLSTKAVDIEPLITFRLPFQDAGDVFQSLSGEGANGKRSLAVLLEYPTAVEPEPARVPTRGSGRIAKPGRIGIGVVGAGNFTAGVLIPALATLDVELRGITSAGGLTARSVADRHGFAYAAGDIDALLEDPMVDAVVVATRHADHADLVTRALLASKAVFVEKPLAIDLPGLERVLAAARGGPPLLVGFNRRFAPATRLVRERLSGISGARVVDIRVNAGAIAADSWVHDPAVGGGRLIGEGCHFIDLATHLIGALPVQVFAMAIDGVDPDAALGDNVLVALRFQDGSIGSITYTAKGASQVRKERVEVFAGGTVATIDDFRSAEVVGNATGSWKGRQDKGHTAELAAFVAALRLGAESPIPLEELAATSRATLLAASSLTSGRPESV